MLFSDRKYAGQLFEGDITFLNAAPNLVDALVEAVDGTLSSGMTRKAVTDAIAEVRNGFVNFLKSTSTLDVSLRDLNTKFVNAFVRWLNQTDRSGAAKWAEATRNGRYKRLVSLIEWLRHSKRWSAKLSPNLDLPINPWAGRSRRKIPLQVIDSDLMSRIRKACICEVTLTMQRFEDRQSMISAAKLRGISLQDVKNSGPVSLDLLLALTDEVIEKNENTIPNYSELPYKLRLAYRKQKGGLSSIIHLFWPTARTLVPFVILMAMAFAYNSDTIREAYIDDFSRGVGLGEFFHKNAATSDDALFKANSMKERSGRRQPVFIPIDNEPDNPAVLYDFVVKWTDRLRTIAPPGIARRLFLFAPISGIGKVTVFGPSAENPDRKSGHGWFDALSSFIKDNDLEHFSLEMVRATVLDLTYEISGGDVKEVQLEGNHVHAQTTVTNYTSDGERQRKNARLATVIELRTRWREGGGVVDPRDRSFDEDLLCATPGWECIDPYDSPFATKDKLCSAYGHCPACPLGGIDLRLPVSYAHAVNLLDAVRRSRLVMRSEDWLERLGPVEDRLVSYWLPKFSQAAIELAKKIDLPPMPRPE
ncbi:hypothetical protein [Paraburkholderia sediminicola]|uniref:hypothetical protein n=1 Tax=Paraburkholderia sediminicola TaxID=458836 RepID=UPI0038B771C7